MSDAVGPDVVMPPFDDKNNRVRATYDVINSRILTSERLPIYINKEDIYIDKWYWEHFMFHSYLCKGWKRAEWFIDKGAAYPEPEYIILDI